jgi:hypothetical protein
MDIDAFLRTVEAEFDEARDAALAGGRFCDKAERIRNHVRAATASLVRCVARRSREEKPIVGQRTPQWEGPQRGSKVPEEGEAQPPRVGACAALAKPEAPAGEGSQPPPQQAPAGEMSVVERRPQASAAAPEAAEQERHLPIKSHKGLPRPLAQRLQAKPAADLPGRTLIADCVGRSLGGLGALTSREAPYSTPRGTWSVWSGKRRRQLGGDAAT